MKKECFTCKYKYKQKEIIEEQNLILNYIKGVCDNFCNGFFTRKSGDPQFPAKEISRIIENTFINTDEKINEIIKRS